MILLSLLLAAAPAPASQLQPLSEFLAGAKTYAVDNREALAQAEDQTSQAYIIMGRALPQLNARGIYTYNQYGAQINVPAGFQSLFGSAGPIVIQAQNQWDAYFTASMPLLDIGTWVRGAAIKPSVAATEESIKARQLDVQRQVARTYYQFGGAAAFIDSAERNLKVAEDNLTLVKARREGGVASELDVARAAAQLESSKQSLVGAQLQLSLAKRALRSLSGIEPSDGIIAFDGNLEDEAPLDTWEGRSKKNLIPALRAAELSTIAQGRNTNGFYLAFLPTVVGQIQEHVSNVTGFVGKHETYLAQLTANWTLDLTTFFTAREQSAQYAIMQAREDRTRLQVLDAIHQSWQQVKSYIANTRAAEAQAKAAALALQIARDRYEGGAATQLEVVQAERDAFAAEVSLIQDRGDLAYSRIELRLFSGQSIEGAP